MATVVATAGTALAIPAPAAPKAAAADNASPIPDPAVLAKYESLFGAEDKQVAATATTKDDARFAAELLEKSKNLSDEPELAALMCRKAYEFGLKDPEGYPSASEAIRRIAEGRTLPEDQLRAKRIELLERQAKKGSSPEQRADAANRLIDEMLLQADQLAERRQYAEAVKRYRDAAAVPSTRAEEIGSLLREVQVRQAVFEKLQKLEQKLAAKPNETALLKLVVRGYLLDLDDPSAAARFAEREDDAQERAMLQLAARPPTELDPQGALKLAGWYQQLAQSASGSAKGTALERAAEYFDVFLGTHTKRDSERLAATQRRDEVLKQLVTVAPPDRNKIVLWNQHNTLENDRGTTRVNLVLYRSGNPVWRRENIRMEWAPDKDLPTTIYLPKVTFDRVRVEIEDWIQNGGGLAEVEVFRNARNIARGAKVSVSGTLVHTAGPETLTDGNTSSAILIKGYWLLPNKSPGWAEVELAAQPAVVSQQRRHE